MNTFTHHGLEILKRSALQVLYECHLWASQDDVFRRPYLSLKEIRRRLGLLHVGVNNDLVKGVLNYLREDGGDGYVELSPWYGSKWHITEEGISVIESSH